MSLLAFAEMSLAECLLFCAGALVFCFAFSGIGCFFAPGKRYCLQVLLGMSLTAALVLIAVSYRAVYGSYIIIAAGALSFVVMAYRMYRGEFAVKDMFAGLAPIGLLYAYFVLRILLQLIPSAEEMDFNCHMTYFADISLEIFRADYASRLRIMDVYPYEWSKYHFFNGCLTAIPLAVFGKKTYFAYVLAKWLTIAVYSGTVYEWIRAKRDTRSAVLFFAAGCAACFALANTLMVWSSFTNQYSCLLLMLLVWLAARDGAYGTALMTGMLLALSAVRSVPTGGVFALYAAAMLYRQGKVRTEWPAFLYGGAVGLGVCVMLFSGIAPSGENMLSSRFFNNMFDVGWRYLIPLGASFNAFEKAKALPAFQYEWLIVPVYVYLLWRQRAVVKRYLAAHWGWLSAAAVFAAAVYTGYMLDRFHGFHFSLARYMAIPVMFAGLYGLPALCLYLYSGRAALPVRLFMGIVVLQFVLFPGFIGICNWLCFVLPVFFCFTEQCMASVRPAAGWARRFAVYGAVAAGVFYAGMYDFRASIFWKPSDFYHSRLPLQRIEVLSEPFTYRSPDDAVLARLHAVKGNRVRYAVLPDKKDKTMAKNAMSLRFLPLHYRELPMEQP